MSRARSRVRQPPAPIVLAYFAAAHVAMLAAAALVVARPQLMTEFYYQPRTIAVVHLVTLGWISGSILGSLYALGPLTWRVEITSGRADWAAFWVWAVSVAGMATHFWIDEYHGMTWAAGTTLAAVVFVGARVVPRVGTAALPFAHRLPVVLAFLNLGLAGLVGVLLGLQKLGLVAIPGPPLGAVFAHAHLAALGWVLMLVFGAGYRLLPMFLPAVMPPAGSSLVAVVLLQLGVLVLASGLLLAHGFATNVGIVLVIAAVVAYLGNVAAMLRGRREPPAELPQPDLALWTTACAFACLLGGLGAGLGLTRADPVAAMRLATVYGVLGLLGFFGQLIAGIGGRLLPLTVWMQEFVRTGYQPLATGLHQLADRRLQLVTMLGWALGVGLIASGAWLGAAGLARAGALAVLAGVAADGVNRVGVVRRARAVRPQ